MGNISNASSSLTNSLGDLQSVLAEVGDFETALDEINSMVEKFADNPMMFGTINSEADKKRYDLLKTLAELLGIEGFSQGGIHDTTGLAMMHGSKSASEVTFNASDAKKLYQLVHSTPNLVASMRESIMNTIDKNGMLSTSNTNNNKTIINNHEWKFGDIFANDPVTFAQLINNYFGTKVTESKVF